MENDIEISKNGRLIIAAMHFPYRKKPCLGIYDPHSNTWFKMATFNNEDTAKDFMEYLAQFVGARK